MITDALKRSLVKRVTRGHDTTYWAIDIHDTLVPSTYTDTNKYDVTKYEYMLDTMRLLSDMPDHRIILWSSTYKIHVTEFISLLKTYNINIDYFNENPECPSNGLGDFSEKFFADIYVDDKSGMNPYEDWEELYDHLCVINKVGIEKYLSIN